MGSGGILFRWRWAVCRSELPAPARHVLHVLGFMMDQHGQECQVSSTRLSELTGMGRSTVRRHLASVEGTWIRVERDDARDPDANRYFPLLPDPVPERDTPVPERDRGSPGAGRDPVPERDTTSTETSASTSTSPPIVDRLWEVWVDVLGGAPPHPSLSTGKRRDLLTRLHQEHLEGHEDPMEVFRQVCEAVRASDHHMSVRAYQLPESLFRNAERRERWVLDALHASSNGDHPPEPAPGGGFYVG